jgi:hypothetical protein
MVHFLFDQSSSQLILCPGRQTRMLEMHALNDAMMHVHTDADILRSVEQEIKLWGLRPHPVVSLGMSALDQASFVSDTHADFVISLPDVGNIEMVFTNSRDYVCLSNSGIHVCKLFL